MDYNQIININIGIKLIRELTGEEFIVAYVNEQELWALGILLEKCENESISMIPIVMAKDLAIMAQFIQMIMNIFAITKKQFPDSAILNLQDYDYLLTGANVDEVHDKNKCS